MTRSPLPARRLLQAVLLVVPLIALACGGSRGATPSAAERPASPTFAFVDGMPAFWALMDSTRGADDAAWLRAYRSRVLGAHPDVYALARGGLDDASLVRFRRSMLARESTMREASARMPALVSKSWTTFVKEFPETANGSVIYLLPAPNNAIGGWYRPLPAHEAVVLGFEGLAGMSADTLSFTAFMHHELTHLLHARTNPDMRSAVAGALMNQGGYRTALYELVWLEGVANAVSRRLNPAAPPTAFLHPRVTSDNEPVRARTARIFLEHMAGTDSVTLERFAYGSTPEVPNGAAYYIGLQVAEELAKERSLSSLLRLRGEALREAVAGALRRIGGPG